MFRKMKKTKEKVQNTIIDNFEVETIETTPEDGFIQQTQLHPANPLDFEKHVTYKKGYSKTKSYSTDDPRITRPFVYGVSTIFMLIGIVSLIFGNWFFGIMFTAISIFTFIKSKEDIDAIAKEKAKQGKDVTIDSKEEAQQLIDNFSNTIKEGFKESKETVWTKKNYKWFLKTALPIYIISSIFISIICFIANIILGVFVVIMLIIIGIVSFYFIYKICKY